MSLVSSINIAQQALTANQTAITTVSNNIANVDTVGYSKLRVNLASVGSTGATSSSPVSIANSLGGVDISKIQRYSDFSMQSYYWEENSTCSYLDQYATSASTVEDLVNELNGTGLSSALTSFYQAADSLNDNPSDITARQNYVSSAENLCTVFNNASSDLTYVQESLTGTATSVSPSKLSDDITSVNDLIDQITKVNQSIVKTNCDGESSPTLLDQRDALVTQLSSLVNVNVAENKNGTVDVSIGKMKLVSSQEVKGYLSASNGQDSDGNVVTTMSIVDPDGEVVYPNMGASIEGGTIGAILDICGTDSSNMTISGIKDTINNLASEFASVFNSIQLDDDSTGSPLCMDSSTLKLTAATEAMFATSDGSTTVTAANISVNSAIVKDPYLIAAARTDTTSSTYNSSDVGNNSNMEDVLAVRTTKYSDLDNMNMEDYLASMVSAVGTGVSNIETSYETEKTVLSEIQTSLSSATGVNLDEELVDLMKYQQAYQAAARVFTTCNDLLDVLINLGK